MEITRICMTCNIEQPITNFIKDNTKACGYRNRCKTCQRPIDKLKYERNKEAYNARMRKFRDTLKGAIATSYEATKGRAKAQEVPFSISLEYVRDLFEKQDGLCALTGEPMVVKGRWSAQSLDKIVPHLGYVEGNVQWLTQRANLIKCNLDNDQFLSLIKQILRHVEGSETIEQAEESALSRVGEQAMASEAHEAEML